MYLKSWSLRSQEGAPRECQSTGAVQGTDRVGSSAEDLGGSLQGHSWACALQTTTPGPSLLSPPWVGQEGRKLSAGISSAQLLQEQLSSTGIQHSHKYHRFWDILCTVYS